MVCKGSESGGRCHGDKPEAVRGCHVSVCPGESGGTRGYGGPGLVVCPQGMWILFWVAIPKRIPEGPCVFKKKINIYVKNPT